MLRLALGGFPHAEAMKTVPGRLGARVADPQFHGMHMFVWLCVTRTPTKDSKPKNHTQWVLRKLVKAFDAHTCAAATLARSGSDTLAATAALPRLRVFFGGSAAITTPGASHIPTRPKYGEWSMEAWRRVK